MISPEKQFFIAIWRMTTPDSYRSICEKFDVSRSTALLATRRVTKILADLAPVLIKWPTGNAIQEVWTGFEGICDHKARFTHGYIGHAGSVHDQHVFRQSEIQDALGNPEKFPDDSHLLDAAYKIHDNLMVPYRDNGHLTERQKNYNFCHSSTRIAIERAFGTLKGRFRSLLHNLSMNRTDLIAHYILACCVMHNICILRNDDFDIVLLNNEVDNDIPRQVAADDTTGVLKRELAIDFQ
ncbi:putative nuclease HARBI1 isoform X2 [Harpegnathos saltator]|uniref:putative nuclease HARBI1 isoform X2 n=1 Tax=Harpegnathos saltator TaxID=610380 RepID=UPI000DBED3CD|nr:putative nuclease HARBI1 isoform X2 [Harpegnathos saltator]